MGLILPQMVKIAIGIRLEYYIQKGYKIPLTELSESTQKRYKRKYGYDRYKKVFVDIEDLPIESNVNIKVECDLCHTIFEQPYQRYNKIERIRGEHYCFHCSHSDLFLKEKHPNWNPNITYEERIVKRNLQEYKDFVKRVLYRDNYTCQCCGIRIDNKAVVHHLDGWNWCVEKRFDDTNGLCLCENCHNIFHSVYGRGNNTKAQFEEWIGHKLNLQESTLFIPEPKKIYCYEDNTYYTINDFIKEYKIKKSNVGHIYDVLNHKVINGRRYLTINKLHIFWEDEYKNMDENILKTYFKSNVSSISVINLTTGKFFDKILAGSETYNIPNSEVISRCCKGKQKTAGKLPDGTPLKWMYYSEFITLPSNKQLKIIEENLSTLEEGSFLLQKYEELKSFITN